jgi:hypothetical protein
MLPISSIVFALDRPFTPTAFTSASQTRPPHCPHVLRRFGYDVMLSALQACFHTDLQCSRIAATYLVLVGPSKVFANFIDASGEVCEERANRDMAAQEKGVTTRWNSFASVLHSQAKSPLFYNFSCQLLRFSAFEEGKSKLLGSFGNAKTLMTPNTSRHPMKNVHITSFTS